MKRSFGIAVVSLTLAGCASVAFSAEGLHESQAVQMDPLVGQPVSAAVTRYGPPASENAVLGQRVVFWFIDNWTIGGQCRIQLTVNDSETIVAWAVNGNCGDSMLKGRAG